MAAYFIKNYLSDPKKQEEIFQIINNNQAFKNKLINNLNQKNNTNNASQLNQPNQIIQPQNSLNQINKNKNQNKINERKKEFRKKFRRVLIVIFIMTILYFIVQLVINSLNVSGSYPNITKNIDKIDIMIKISYFISTILISYISTKF